MIWWLVIWPYRRFFFLYNTDVCSFWTFILKYLCTCKTLYTQTYLRNIPLIGMMILWKVINRKPCQICNMNFNSVIQSCKVKLCSNIFEAADNNFDDLNSDHWDQYPITMVTWYCWELWHRLFVYQWYVCRPQHPAARSTGWANDVITSWWSRASWELILCLGLILCVGVTFFSLEIFYCLEWYYSDMRSRDGWRHHFMVVTWILVWFFSVLDEIFVLVWFCLSWCDFITWCNQPNLGMIFLRFGYNFRFSEIKLFWCRWISWCDQLHLGMIFLHFARLFRL